MAEQDEQARHDNWAAIGARTDIPYPARVYNYLLGGTDYFAADRAAAEMSLTVMPEIRDSARGNRLFLARAVAFLREAGIRHRPSMRNHVTGKPRTGQL